MTKYIISLFSIKYKILKSKKIKLFKAECKAFEKAKNEFITYRRRAKIMEDMHFLKSDYKEQKDVAIIMQGPVLYDENFTINTLRYYRKMYPEILIIVSTWKGTQESFIKECEKINVKVICSDDVEVTGIGNINRQLLTTNVGLDYCKNKNIKYVMKTRTDQRIYKPFFIEYLISLLKAFPSSNEGGIEQKDRIITIQSSIGSSLFIPYFISDLFLFGNIDDIKKYFNCPFSKINHKSRKERNDFGKKIEEENIYTYYSIMAPEVILAKNYVKTNINKKFEESLYASWNFIKHSLISISFDDLNLFWLKYNYLEESANFHLFEDNDSENKLKQYNWTFNNWISLYSGNLEYKKDYERFKLQKAGEVLK